MSKGGPVLYARLASSKNTGRSRARQEEAAQRAAEKRAMRELSGLSVPAAKKLIRRKKGKKK